ncbi:MAG: hypothetical protein QF441_13420 [Bacteriovoracaceae bacterium]|jgi:hypothetical protein|nr:hypothetical protein [Bacteriovoracaceae bacterium]
MYFRIIFTLFIAIFGLSSCLDAPSTRRISTKLDEAQSLSNRDPGTGHGIINDDGSVTGDEENPIAKVEIRHLVEPKVDESSDGGEYKRKLTIPKNYDGYLYLAGINISSLASKSISVRFKFGLNEFEKTIPATVSTAPGLTPQTDIEVLIMDFRSKPFQDISLPYDLYDYNNYDFSGSSSDPGILHEPVSFNRNDKLFCRGLSLEDDSTFTGSLAQGCVNSDDTCKYAFAKVVDKGLVTAGTPDIPIIPDELNTQVGNDGYYLDSDEIALGRCLPDNPLLTGTSYVYAPSTVFTTFESTQVIDSLTYYYRGPYRPLNQEEWQISEEAIKGNYGVFGGVYDDNLNGKVDDYELEYGYLARLFPLYTKFDLLKNTEYMGSAIADAEKVLTTMNSNGESLWMDGCNKRANTVHEITGEHIGSCSVTATIEIIAEDSDGDITVVDITDEVKLQLVKPSALQTEQNNDILFSSFQQCSSSAQCGSDSCCVNKRCWSKSLVSQCVDDLPSYGSQPTGELCTSDYQCSSLCCNKASGRCAPHDTISSQPSYCSKPTGQSCVAKEWCAKHPVTTCAIVKTGTDPYGGVTCAKRCVTVAVFGECSAADGSGVGVCTPPCQPADVVFNPSDPNRCNEAITFDQLVDLANNPTCE